MGFWGNERGSGIIALNGLNGIWSLELRHTDFRISVFALWSLGIDAAWCCWQIRDGDASYLPFCWLRVIANGNFLINKFEIAQRTSSHIDTCRGDTARFMHVKHR